MGSPHPAVSLLNEPVLVERPRVDRTGSTRIRSALTGLVRVDGPVGNRMGDSSQRPQAGSSDGLLADTEGRIIHAPATSSAARLIELPPPSYPLGGIWAHRSSALRDRADPMYGHRDRGHAAILETILTAPSRQRIVVWCADS
jgi:hypothetical protein